MDIIGIIYDILDVNLVSRGMLGDVVNTSGIIMPYIGYIALFGLLVGFYIYRRYMKYYNRDIYNIDGNMYYRVKTKDKGGYLIKDKDGNMFFEVDSFDQIRHCKKCSFYCCPGISAACNLLETHKACPLRGKGYFIEIGNGL